MGRLLRRLRFWFDHRRASAELAEEIESHRAMKQERLEQAGLSAKEASIASKRVMGNALVAREEARDVWGWIWLDDAWRDLRSSLRDFRKAPGFWLGASLILSLGIGVNLAAFQLLDAVFWRPPQIREPESLVRLFRGEAESFPYPAVSILEATNNVLSSVLVRSDSMSSAFSFHRDLVWGDDPENKPWASFVSANWFDELDYQPIRGRVFHQGIDDAPDAQPGVVISDVFWKRKLNSDPEIVGKKIRMNNRSAIVLGVVPPDIMPHNDTMVWMSITQIDYFMPGIELKTSWSLRSVQVYGRLRPGITIAAARQRMQPAMNELIRQHPKAFREGDFIDPAPGSSRFTSSRRAQERWIITGTAFGLTLLILAIACANLINLVLSRTVSRMRDLSVRVALGASRWRVLRQLLGESVLLVVMSSVGGFVLVYWASRIFMVMAGSTFPGSPDFNMNWRTVFATLTAGAVAIVAVGLFPAWRISRADLITAMKDGGHQASASLSRTRWRHILLAAQIGCSCLLLVLTGLILHSVQRVMTDVGFDHENVAVFTAPLERQGIKGNDALSYWNRLREAVASHPEVSTVSLVSHSPLERRAIVANSDLLGALSYYEVGPGFFDVMKIPILRGRDFDDADRFGTSAIINKRLALKMYGTLDVIEKAFPKDKPRGTVVGVVGDVRLTQSESEDGSDMYAPLDPANSNRTLIARAGTNAATLAPLMSTVARGLNEDIIPDAHLLSKDFANRGGDAWAMSRLLSVLGLLALSITCVGIFGTVSFAAMLQRQEIGIRMALGAGRESMVLLLLTQLRWPLIGGLAFGLAASIPAGYTFSGVPLFVKPFDPPVMAVVAFFIVVTAVVAAALPAWRALRSDPLQSLRSE